MARFKLPPISPLAGSTLSNFFGVIKNKSIAPRYYVKVGFTFLFVLVGSLFHWRDSLYFNKKVQGYSFKKSPVFIIGHWRSGTTFLHNLLTRDPVFGFVTTYQAVFPNNLRSSWLFKTFMRLVMPKTRPGDDVKISVDLPQEDEYALSNTSRHSFYHFFYFPTHYREFYRNYVRFNSQSENEMDNWQLEYRKLVIKALINTGGEQALLKNPVNTGRMRRLLDIFPDAHFIFIIRNPIIVYLSSKKFFTQLFPTLNLEKFSNTDISKMILDNYVKLLQDYLTDKKRIHAKRIIEIQFEVFHQDPIMETEKIYNKFGLGDFQEMAPAFLQYLYTQKGHKNSTYTIERKELDRVTASLEFAMNHWKYGIPNDLVVIENKQMPNESTLKYSPKNTMSIGLQHRKSMSDL